MAKLNGVIGSLDDREQLAYADAVGAAFRRGDIDAHDALAAMAKLAPSKTTDVALAPLNTIGWIWEHEVRTDAQRARVRDAVKAAYLPRLEALGYTRKAGESPDDVSMRSSLAGMLGLMVKLPEVRAELLKQGDAVLKAKPDGSLNYGAANPDLLGNALAVSVEEHGKPVVDTLMAQLTKTSDPAQRNAMLSALGNAKGDQAERVRDFSLNKDVKVGEMARLLYGGRDTAQGRTDVWNWFVKHYDQVVARSGSFSTGYLPGLAGGGGCSQAEADRMQTFFKPRLKDLTGADRGLAQSTESTLLCAALKAEQDPDAITR
jgi:alanyl aminopeptidase